MVWTKKLFGRLNNQNQSHGLHRLLMFYAWGIATIIWCIFKKKVSEHQNKALQINPSLHKFFFIIYFYFLYL